MGAVCCGAKNNFNDAGAGRTLGDPAHYGSIPSQTGSSASANAATANPAQREEMRRAAEARQAAVRFAFLRSALGSQSTTGDRH